MIRISKSLCLASTLLAGCSDSFDASTSTGARTTTPIGSLSVSLEPPITWEKFKASAYNEPGTDRYVVDGDILLTSEEELREFYESWGDDPGALTARNVLGADVVWGFPDRHQLSYCISDGFDNPERDELVRAVRGAAQGWQRRVGVRFQHLSAEDPDCDEFNENVMFNIVPEPDDESFSARAFFPDDNRGDRRLLVTSLAFTTDDGGRDLLGIMMHELGHVLGFRHEHINLAAACTVETNHNSRLVTAYDEDSVMHYPQCRTPAGGGYRISASDYAGAISLYGLAPALTVSL